MTKAKMTLLHITKTFNLQVVCGEEFLDREIANGYAGDLLSDVIANTEEGDLWITLQVHLNIVAVAVMKDLSGIILIGGRKPEEETLVKAQSENMPVLTTPLPAFELAGRLYSLGITGIKDA